MLQAGQHAPPFSLPDADMETVELADFRGRSDGDDSFEVVVNPRVAVAEDSSH